MLSSLIKFITTTLLAGVLGFLMTHREISIPKATPKEEAPLVTSPLPSTKETKKEEVTSSHGAAELPKTQYETLNKLSDTDETYRPKTSPCDLAMGYKLGTFDERFGIGREKFIATIDDASSLWEKSIGRRLFFYDPNGSLTINLIYDERQEKTDTVNNLALEIENSKAIAENLKQAHEQEKQNYLNDMEDFTKDADLLQKKYKDYSAKVDTYNALGGAKEDDYKAMQEELAALKIEAKSMEDRRAYLLTKVDEINKKVVRYNELVAHINTLIRKSNALGKAQFTEGRFVPKTNSIDIFQYNNSNKLLRVMTHELGHTLGINHNDNQKSIMYSFNSATTTSLSKEDSEALSLICNH